MKNVERVKQLFFQQFGTKFWGVLGFTLIDLGVLVLILSYIYKHLKANQQAYVIIKQAMAALEAEQSPSIWLGVLDQ